MELLAYFVSILEARDGPLDQQPLDDCIILQVRELLQNAETSGTRTRTPANSISCKQSWPNVQPAYTFSTLLGRQIKGRCRGHQPFPNKMKYCWPKVSVQPPSKSVVCWVGYLFFKNWRQILYKYWFSQSTLKKGSVLVRLTFFKCRWPSLCKIHGGVDQ